VTKLQIAAEEEDDDCVYRETVYDKLARPPTPSGLQRTASQPLGNQLLRSESQAKAFKKQEDLRRVFDRIDRNNDGKICPNDLGKQFRDLGHPYPRSALEQMIFEFDDRGRKKIDFEIFSNLWVRMKKPLGAEEVRGIPLHCELPLGLPLRSIFVAGRRRGSQWGYST
jgi:hypothetical protein